MDTDTEVAFLKLIKCVGDPAHESDLRQNCLSSSSSGEIDIYFENIPNLSEHERKSINEFFNRRTKSAFLNHCGIREHKSMRSGQHVTQWTFNPRLIGDKIRDWYHITTGVSLTPSRTTRSRRPTKRAREENTTTRPGDDNRLHEPRFMAETSRLSPLNEAAQELATGAIRQPYSHIQIAIPTESEPLAAVPVRRLSIRFSTSTYLRFLGEHGRDPPVQRFDEQSRFVSVLEQFLKTQQETQLLYCSTCSQRKWPDNFSRRFQSMPQQSQLQCLQCEKDKGSVKRLSKENLMHPMVAPSPDAMEAFLRLPPLQTAEEMLLSPYQPIMRVYRLKGGSLGFSGCCVNLPHNIGPICTSLPRSPESISIMIVKRPRSDDATDYKQYRVRRNVLLQWIEFLMTYNPLFRQYITLNEEELNRLPEDGSIEHRLPHIEASAPPPQQAESDHENFRTDGEDHEEEEEEDSGDEDDFFDQRIDGVNEAVIDQVTESGFSMEAPVPKVTEAEKIRRMCEAGEAIPWPEQTSDQLLCEYTTPNLLAFSFPYLFPFGIGDVTNKVRHTPISIKDALEHYLRYAYFDTLTGQWIFPFGGHGRFVHYLQDLDERQRIVSQANVYITKNKDDTRITGDVLRNIASARTSSEFFSLSKRLQTYSSNVLGSNGYFAYHKKQLLALMESEGIGTVWFTLSFANYYWADFLHLFGPMPQKDVNESEEAFEKRWKKEGLRRFNMHPQIADEFFYRRTESFLQQFLGPDGLDALWHWYRYEYQSRGTIHLHGLARLRSDPGLDKLGQLIYKGRKAAQLLQQPLKHGDVIVPLPEDFQPITNRDDISKLEEDVRIGEDAERKVIKYHDFLVTAWNPDPNPDAKDQERSPYEPLLSHHHPSATYIGNGKDERYRRLCEVCMRHRHSRSYCQEKGYCRFRFPKPITESTQVLIEELTYKKGSQKGKVRRTMLKIVPKTNDGWLNTHSKIGLQYWGGNLDLQILLDTQAVLLYVAKYVAKTETLSAGLVAIHKSVIKRVADTDDINPAKVLRHLFQKLTGGRDKSLQESCHLGLSLPLVRCSKKFVTVNLVSNIRKVNVEALENEHAVESKIQDLYPQRLNEHKWFDKHDYNRGYLEVMSCREFCRIYKRVKGEKIACVEDPSNTVITVSPQYSSKKTSDNYYRYCYVQLWANKPFVDHPYQTFNHGIDIRSAVNGRTRRAGVSGDEAEYADQVLACPLLSEPSEEIKGAIVAAWTNFASIRGELLQERVSQIREEELKEAEEDNDGIIRDSSQQLFSQVTNDSEFNEFARSVGLIREPDDEVAFTWDETFDFRRPAQEYNCEGEFNIEFLLEKWDSLKGSEISRGGRREVHRHQLNAEQMRAHDEVVRIVRGEVECSYKVVLTIGRGGTGKSWLVDAITTTLCSQSRTDVVKVLAPTGKAALNIGGQTLHAKDGLLLPVTPNDEKDLTGESLNALQRNYKDIQVVVIDEYSFLSLTMLYWINRRLQQAKVNDLPFGGLCVLLTGDPAQLPPVGGNCLWAKKGGSGKPLTPWQLEASEMYRKICIVFKLIEVKRLEPGQERYGEFLERLASACVTIEDWQFINDHCTIQAIGQQRFDDTFAGLDSTWLFERNKSANEHNSLMLRKNTNPILRLSAIHDCPSSRRREAELCRKLEPTLYLAVGARVMLLWNVLTTAGLVNGATGVVKDFLFDGNSCSDDGPVAVIVEFKEYVGPPFFSKAQQSQWVPIFLETEKWKTYNKGIQGESHFRKQFPLALAWAWTYHKMQGTTIKGPLVLKIEEKESTHGLTYVGFSRSGSVDRVCILNGVSYERFNNLAVMQSVISRLEEDRRLNKLVEARRRL